MTGSKGQPVKNQFILEEEGRGALGNFISRTTFQSYDSIIAVKTIWDKEDVKGFGDEGTVEIELDEAKWDYSTTTGKYRNLFLGEDKKTTEKKIADGTYRLVNLN